MRIKSWLAAFAFFATTANATPIQFTQTFSNVTWDDYDVAEGLGFGTQPLGDWIFSGFVDSEAVDLQPQHDDIGMYAATNITLTQADLGLDHVGITNLSFLYFLPDRFGFDSNVNFGSVWTRIVTEPGHFLAGQTLDEYLALAVDASINHQEDGFGPQWGGFALEDGRRIYGWGFAESSSVSISQPTSVPEPGTLPLMLGMMGAMLLTSRRRRPASA